MCLRWNMDKRPLFLQKTMFGKQILTWVQENQMTIHGNNGKHLEDKELTCLVETLLQGFTGRNGFSWKLKATLTRSIWLNMVLVAYGNSNHPLAFFVVDPFAFSGGWWRDSRFGKTTCKGDGAASMYWFIIMVFFWNHLPFLKFSMPKISKQKNHPPKKGKNLENAGDTKK